MHKTRTKAPREPELPWVPSLVILRKINVCVSAEPEARMFSPGMITKDGTHGRLRLWCVLCSGLIPRPPPNYTFFLSIKYNAMPGRYGYAKARKYRTRRIRRTRRTTRRTTRPARSSRSLAKVTPFRSIWKNPLPLTGMFKFKYHDTGYDMSTVGATFTNAYVFSGNGMYDPDVTGVGVQPYSYDNYCNANAPFQRYHVYASKIKIYPHVTEATVTNIRDYKWIVLATRLNPPTYTEFQDLKRTPGARCLVINSLDDNRGHLSAYMSTRRILNEQPAMSADVAPLYSANPTIQWYWYIQCDSYDSALAIDCVMDVEITYYCRLARRDDVNES